MIAFMAAGLFSYLQLGRQEDSDFTIKTMVIKALWPGAAVPRRSRAKSRIGSRRNWKN
jgi:multidrug efflux pump subunit AcrB